MKENRKLLFTDILKKFSTFYWNIIDNLATNLEKFADKYYKLSIGKRYQMEYIEFDINKNDKVLHIGSGSYPLTEITLATFVGSKIVGIDKKEKAVLNAKKVVRKKNLNDNIKITMGNGINYKVSEFDVIIISSCAIPMLEILNHILKNCKGGCKIIIRELQISFKPLMSFMISKKIYPVKTIQHHPLPFFRPFGWISLLIKKS